MVSRLRFFLYMAAERPDLSYPKNWNVSIAN